MESPNANPIDDSTNLDSAMQDLVDVKYEDCNSEVLAAQGEDDQTHEQIYLEGYLEVQNPDSENATIYLNSQDLNLNGHRLILTQNDDGNEVFVVVRDDLNGQSLEQNFIHTGQGFELVKTEEVLGKTDEVLVKTDEVLVKTDEVSQDQERHVYIESTDGMIKIKRESLEVPQEQERHVYIESTDGMIKIKRESVEVPQGQERHVYIENIDEMMKIDRESVEVPQEQERHIYIENNDRVINIKSDNQCSINSGAESPLWPVSSNGQQKSNSTEMLFIPNPTVVSSSALMLAPEETKHPKLMQLACIAHKLQSADQNSGGSDTDTTAKDSDSPLNDTDTSVIVTQDPLEKDSNPRLASTDSESTRTLDNAVSVIHITRELQNNFENQAKLAISYEISCPENYSAPKSDDELPADVLSSSASRDSLQELPDPKPVEDSSSKDLEDDRISSPDDVDQSNISNSLLNTESGSLSGDISPETFEEQSPKLDDTLAIENSSMEDEDSHAGSCLLVVEEDESKDGGNTSDDKSEIIKDAEMATSCQKQQSNIIQVPMESDNDSISKSETVACKLNVSMKNESSPLSTKYSVFSYKSKAKTLFSTGSSLSTSALHPVHDAGEISEAMSQYEFSDSEEEHFRDAECRRENNHKSNILNSQSDSLVKNLNADLVISESVEGLEMDSVVTATHSLESSSSQNLELKETTEAESASVATDSQHSTTTKEPSENEISENLTASQDSQKVNSKDCLIKNSIDDSLNSTCTTSKEGEDSEETFVKPPKKTYIKKKNRNPTSVCDGSKNGIELFSLDHMNFSECDKEIEEAKKSVNKDQCEHVLDVAAKDPEEKPPQLDNSEPGPSQENSIETTSPPENGVAADDFFPMNIVKVSATYNNWKKPKPEVKSLPPKQEIGSRKTRSSASKRPLENGTLGNPNSETHKNSFDSSSSENIPWGDVLLRTSFQSNVTNNAPSTSQTAAGDIPCITQAALIGVPSTSRAASSGAPSTYSVNITSTPISEQQRRRTNKLKRDFDRLLHSPKSKTAGHRKMSSNRRLISDIKKKSKRDKSKLNSRSSKSDATRRGSSNRVYSESVSESRVKRPRYQGGVKKAEIQYLKQSAVSLSATASRNDNTDFHCPSCNFSSGLVNNLIEHLKYCENRHPFVDYTAEDMDKRQRIRGEDIDTSEKLRDFITGSFNEMRHLNDLNEGECSGLSQNHVDSDEEMDADVNDRKSKYGYGVDDVVWAKIDDRFWPGLVCELGERKASIKLINYPREMRGLKISAERVHTFDDAKWNKMLLAEAASLEDNEIFVRAVQTSETFVRKKWLGLNVRGKDFFSISEEVDFVTDNESSDCNINEDSDFDELDICTIPHHRKARYNKLDRKKIKDYILGGHVDQYVLDIYNKKQSSEKHKKYCSDEKHTSLGEGTWFGPCENFCEGVLVEHFRRVFFEQIGQRHFILSYILQVWIPEAIIKAISVVADISIKAAGEMFESEDSTDLGDPSIEEIEKMYS